MNLLVLLVSHSLGPSLERVYLVFFCFDLFQQQNFAQKIIFDNKNVLSLAHLILLQILDVMSSSLMK